jgi:hypothetical protein
MGRRFIVTKHATGSDLLNQKKKKEDPMNRDVSRTRVVDGIAVITLGSARRTYFNEGTGDALTVALDGFAPGLCASRDFIRDGNPGPNM